MLKQSRSSACYKALLCVVLTLEFCCTPAYATLSSLAKNDPFPMFSPNDPQEYLLTKVKLDREAEDWAEERGDTFSFSVSAFFQNADEGKPFNGGESFF